MDWMFMPYRRYADFSGRSRRKEYWMFVLFTVIVYMAILLIGGGLGSVEEPGGLFSGLSGILLIAFWVVTLVPAIAVQVRRFHDQDKSGWWILLGFVPIIGGLAVLVFMCFEGTRGPNEYGPDPKEGEHAGVPDRGDTSGGVNMR